MGKRKVADQMVVFVRVPRCSDSLLYHRWKTVQGNKGWVRKCLACGVKITAEWQV